LIQTSGLDSIRDRKFVVSGLDSSWVRI